MSMSYQPPPEGPRPPPWTPPPSTGPTPLQWVLIATGVALGLVFAALLTTRPSAAVPPAAVTLAPIPAPAAEAIEEPPIVPQRQPPPRRVTNDMMAAARIGGMEAPQRDAALCALLAQSDPTVNAGLLERNPSRFLGHLWAFEGDVIQIEDIPGEQGSFLLIMLDDEANSTVAVSTYLRPPDTVITGRTVRVYGRVAGTFSYTTRAGNESTVPKVLGTAVILKREAPRCRRR